MNFTEAVKAVFKKYFDFKTRSLRSEFWYWILFGIIAGAVISVIDKALFDTSLSGEGPIGTIVDLLTFIPGLAVGARRLHDTGKSGWWQLIALTIIGIIPLVLWFCQEGTKGKNSYGGPAPKTA
jgi:uncharacterized membrane protein YhaH (DUF805 family)